MKCYIAAILAMAACVRADEPSSPMHLEMHHAVSRLLPSNAINVITLKAPRSISLRELGLEALKEGPVIVVADEIRIFSSKDVLNARPLVRIWRNSREGGRWWYQTGGVGSAEHHVIEEGQAVFVITRASKEEIEWSNPLAE